MTAVTREVQKLTPIPAANLFKVCVELPENLPQVIKSSEILQGNGGPGTIKKITLADGYVHNRIDAIDKDNFTYAFTSFDGKPWVDAIDKVSYEFKFVPSPDGGSIQKSVMKYYPKGNSKLNEEQIKAVEEKFAEIVKIFDANVLAKPQA